MKLMSRHQFRRVLEAHEWTHERIAALLDMNPRQIRRYVSGAAPIPHVVALALHYLRDQHNQELI